MFIQNLKTAEMGSFQFSSKALALFEELPDCVSFASIVLKIYYFVYICIEVCTHECMHLGGQKRALHPSEQELQVVETRHIGDRN